jgi:hypothetical protein
MNEAQNIFVYHLTRLLMVKWEKAKKTSFALNLEKKDESYHERMKK